jgi:hypothetical protein
MYFKYFKFIKTKILITVATLAVLIFTCQQVLAQDWYPIRSGRLFGISGITLSAQQGKSLSFLVVHDNKQAGQGRLASIILRGNEPPQYVPLQWPAKIPLPFDLEAITLVPSEKDTLLTRSPERANVRTESSFMALTSSGKIYHFRLNIFNRDISINKIFNLPDIPKKSNFEGFSLTEIDDKLLAVWAHRGAIEEPAVIYWGQFDLETYQFSSIGATSFKVPWPIDNVRHISDLKVDSTGVLFISAAKDPGNNGPFESAVYIAGVFNSDRHQITFRQNSELVPLYRFDGHKIEAIELVSGQTGGVIFGTDDENKGSSIYTSW